MLCPGHALLVSSYGSAVREMTTLCHPSSRACSSSSVALKAVQVELSFCSTGRSLNRGSKGDPRCIQKHRVCSSCAPLYHDGACTQDCYKVIIRRIDRRRYLYHTEDRKIIRRPPTISYEVVVEKSRYLIWYVGGIV